MMSIPNSCSGPKVLVIAEQDAFPGVLEITESAVKAQSWRLQEQGLHLALARAKHLTPVALKLLRSDRAEVL